MPDPAPETSNGFPFWQTLANLAGAFACCALVAAGLLGTEALHVAILSVLFLLFIACGGLLGLIGIHQLGAVRRWDLGSDTDSTVVVETASQESNDAHLDRQVQMSLQRIHRHSLSRTADPGESLRLSGGSEREASRDTRRHPPRRAA